MKIGIVLRLNTDQLTTDSYLQLDIHHRIRNLCERILRKYISVLVPLLSSMQKTRFPFECSNIFYFNLKFHWENMCLIKHVAFLIRIFFLYNLPPLFSDICNQYKSIQKRESWYLLSNHIVSLWNTVIIKKSLWIK